MHTTKERVFAFGEAREYLFVLIVFLDVLHCAFWHLTEFSWALFTSREARCGKDEAHEVVEPTCF